LISILAALNKKQDQTISVEVLLKQTALSSVELSNLLTMMAKWGISSFGPSEDVRLTQLGKSIWLRKGNGFLSGAGISFSPAHHLLEIRQGGFLRRRERVALAARVLEWKKVTFSGR
jgi:hypothetical protein